MKTWKRKRYSRNKTKFLKTNNLLSMLLKDKKNTSNRIDFEIQLIKTKF